MTALAVSLWMFWQCPVACERAAEVSEPAPAPPRAVIQPIGPPVNVRPWTPPKPPTTKKDTPNDPR